MRLDLQGARREGSVRQPWGQGGVAKKNLKVVAKIPGLNGSCALGKEIDTH